MSREVDLGFFLGQPKKAHLTIDHVAAIVGPSR